MQEINEGDTEPVEREVVDERKHPQMGAKAKEVILRRNGEEQRQVELYRKVRQRHATLEGDGVAEHEHWEKITTLSQQAATETLFALAELHGYELNAK